MVRRTGKTHFERFQAAVMAGDDEQAEQIVPLLTEADAPRLRGLAQADDNQRWWAVRGLAAVGGADDVPFLLRCLADPNPMLRAGALLALAALYSRYPDAVAPHLERMAGALADEDGLVRQAAADALARCGDGAVDALAVALESPHDGVRVRAAKALHRVGSLAAAPALYQHLDDPNPLVRHYAYETLERLGLLNNILLTRGE